MDWKKHKVHHSQHPLCGCHRHRESHKNNTTRCQGCWGPRHKCTFIAWILYSPLATDIPNCLLICASNNNLTSETGWPENIPWTHLQATILNIMFGCLCVKLPSALTQLTLRPNPHWAPVLPRLGRPFRAQNPLSQHDVPKAPFKSHHRPAGVIAKG